MATTIEELAIRFSAQTEDLTRELRRLESTATRTSKRTAKKMGAIQKSLNSIKSAAMTAGGALLAAFAGRAIINGIREIFSSMNDLQTSAEGLGTTVENLQELRFAFTAVGADASKVEQVVRDFTKRIGEAKQNLGTLLPFLEKFDLQLENIDGTAKSVDQLMDEVADKIANMTDATDRAALANAAFGRVWVDVVAVMGKGSESLRELRKQARETGSVMSGEMVKAAAEADAQFNTLALTVGTKTRLAFLGLLQVFNILEKGQIQKIGEEIDLLDSRLGTLISRKFNIEGGGLGAISEAGLFEDRQQAILRETNVAIEKTINKINELLKKRSELRNPPKEPSGASGGTAKTNAEIEKELKALDRVKAKVTSDLESLRQEIFKINNDVFAVINESARLELEAFKKTFEGKVGFEEQFLEAKKLIEAKRIQSTIEAQTKIDEAAKNAQEKRSKEKLSQEKSDADEAARILDENMREAQRHADDFANSFSSAFDELIFAGGKLSDVLKGLLKDLARMVLHKAILGPISSALGAGLASSFGFASGGVMTSGGPAPLRNYAHGGIASSPQTAVFGEGARPEAFVPLSDGRNIPVKIVGGGGAGGNVVQIEQKIFFTTDVQASVRAEILNMLAPITEASKAAVFAAQNGVR